MSARSDPPDASRLIGYSDRVSAAPGETVQFMVSAELDSFRAELTRFEHGHGERPGLCFAPIDSELTGGYAGSVQSLQPGSYVRVDAADDLPELTSFTIQMWIWPTTPAGREQGLLARGSPDEGGYGLALAEGGELALWLADGQGHTQRVASESSLRAREWYFVAGGFDAARGIAWLAQEPASTWPNDPSGASVEASTELAALGAPTGPILLAAAPAEEPSSPEAFFNGKLERPLLVERSLGPNGLDALKADQLDPATIDGLVGLWDFAREIPTDLVRDVSGNGLDGRAVNAPTRAVTGRLWTGRELSWAHAPDEYAAIHFHDDDLEDAGWEATCEWTVPDGTASGAYALRLSGGNGDEDHLPFFVRPASDAPRAPVAFLASTLTYLAYANTQLFGLPATDPQIIQPEDRYVTRERLLSLYDTHSDGSGVVYASRLRPLNSLRPSYRAQNTDCYLRLSADLYLLDWLQAKGFAHDVITDDDLHREGLDLLSPYNAVVSSSHPEYCTDQMLTALGDYTTSGGRLMYMGGNGFYWVVTVGEARDHLIELRRGETGTRTWQGAPGESFHSMTGEPGGLWRGRGRAPQRLTGIGFTGWGTERAVPYRREPDSHDPRAAFIFEGVGDDEVIGDFGEILGAAGGYEIDRFDRDLGTPPHALLVASTGVRKDVFVAANEDLEDVAVSEANAPPDPNLRGDMVYFETPNGGAVFSTGGITWCGSLPCNGYDNNVSLITENVLRRFSSS